MTKRLTGRTAVVTGTAHGIGAGIAAALQDSAGLWRTCPTRTGARYSTRT